MKKNNWKIYALWIVAAELTGGAAALLTRDGMELYRWAIDKPPLSPPPILFPIVWGLLYALMGVAAARIYLTPPSEVRTRGLRLYWIQLAVNFLWSIIFFSLEWFGAAFFWLLLLLALIVWMTSLFYRLDTTAAYLLIPYILWVAFAGYLNAGVWLLNR